MRLHLFEFEDLPWFPDVIRRGGTDFLRYLLVEWEAGTLCNKYGIGVGYLVGYPKQ